MISVTGTLTVQTRRKTNMKKVVSTGFTLIELMIVIVIIGVLATAVALNFTGESRQSLLNKETERLQQRIQLASELAMMKQLELGLFIDEEGYRFMLFEQDKWQIVLQPATLAEHKFAKGMGFELELEGLEWAEKNLLSKVEWQEEDDQLFEENSFDQLEADKALAEQEDKAKSQEDARKQGKTVKPAKRATGFITQPRKKTDPQLPMMFILSSGEITPFLLTLREDSDLPVLVQELKAEFSIPLERGEVKNGR
jgi:general secretion pathway protein H